MTLINFTNGYNPPDFFLISRFLINPLQSKYNNNSVCRLLQFISNFKLSPIKIPSLASTLEINANVRLFAIF
jgi:hypothetical protein